jgi:PAS domain S-box-containing protein
VYVVIFSLVSAAALVFYSALLILTWQRGFDRSVTRWFALYLASMAIWSLGALMMYVDPQNAAAWNRVMLSGTVLMPLTFYGFVESALSARRSSRWVALGAVLVVAVLILNALGYFVGNISVTGAGLIGFSYGPATPLFGIYYFLFIGLAAVDLVRALQTTKDFAARNRAKYVSLGLAVIVFGSLTNLSSKLGQYPLDITANVVNALLLTYAISRYNLLDINIVIRKGLAYALSVALVAAGYLAIVLLDPPLHRLGSARVLIALLVIIAISVVMQPGREWLQTRVDRLFFREKYDAGLMLQRLSRQVASLLDLEQLARMILDEVCSAMQTPAAALLIRDRESQEYITLARLEQTGDEQQANALANLRLRADHPIADWLAKHDKPLLKHDLNELPQFKGLWAQERADLEAAGAELFIGLSVGRQLVGILVLGPKRSEASYVPEDLRTLQTLSNQAAVAVQNAWLYRDALTEKARAQTILQAAFAGIVVVDPNLRIVAMNPSAESITGGRLAALRGRPLAELFGPGALQDDQPLAEALAAVAALAPTEITFEDGGHPHDLLMGMTPLRDGFLLNFTDITRLKEVDRLKSEIVANVSHELRGPLASIKGYTELLLEEMDGEDRALRLRFLSVIDEETDRLAGFINNMLDLSRLESGHVELALAPVSIDVLVAEVVLSVGLQARAADVHVQVETSAVLPPFMADRGLMHSALKNLVSNAIKFSPRGATVTITERIEGSALVVDVIDHGPGISAEDLPHMFTKFYRGEATLRRGVGGTGLGLAMAKQAIELHRGTLTVESEPGRGSTFIVTLPLNAAQTALALEGGLVVSSR